VPTMTVTLSGTGEGPTGSVGSQQRVVVCLVAVEGAIRPKGPWTGSRGHHDRHIRGYQEPSGKQDPGSALR
jgi:hypothetical protein